MYIFVNWSLHQATCHDQSGCARGNQPENFSLLVDTTIFFCFVRTRASEVPYVDLVQILHRGTVALRVEKKGVSSHYSLFATLVEIRRRPSTKMKVRRLIPLQMATYSSTF
jgi:hypothetical protein